MTIDGGGGGGSWASPSAGKYTNFVLLSEGCVSNILSHTSPRDACTASSISRGFKCLSDSDAVWERFLPSVYQDIICRSVSPVIYSSKKELYFRLCDSPVLLDDGNMSFSLNKQNGKKCFMLGAEALSIAWQDTNVFWRWISLPQSRFSKVAELLAVCWLEIKAKFTTRMLSSETTYAAYLVYNIAPVSHGLDFPANTLVTHVNNDGENGRQDVAPTATIVYLTPPKTGETLQTSLHAHSHTHTPTTHTPTTHTAVAPGVGVVPQRRADGWMEIELGKFYKDKTDGEVDMRFMETHELHWKSGLIVEGIDIRPATTHGEYPT